MIINNKQLVDWNRRGLIPGCDETETNFLKRCFSSEPAESSFFSSRLSELYDLSPDWVQCFYSNHNLHFWEGGCTWQGLNDVRIQLRAELKERNTLLGIYSKEEILTHEMVHAVRLKFLEDRFEEALAYRTSRSWFRRFFGPILHKPIEGLIFLTLAMLTWISVLYPFAHLITFLALCGSIIFSFWRLASVHYQLHRAEKNLSQLVGNKASALLIRLTSEEIVLFASQTPGAILEYALKKSHSLRWRQINASYFASSLTKSTQILGVPK